MRTYIDEGHNYYSDYTSRDPYIDICINIYILWLKERSYVPEGQS